MSAPEVGDRVRVIAGQWTGWWGVVRDAWHGYQTNAPWLSVELQDFAQTTHYIRTIAAAEVEKVPTTPKGGHGGDETGADVHADPDAGSGAQNARTPEPDMTLPGEAFCADCPDHEACASGYPCDMVHRVAREAAARRRRSKP